MTTATTHAGPIESRLRACRAVGRPGLIAFANAGDPDMVRSADVLAALAERVDVLELGVPFPDSCSDGATLRRSHARGLAAGADFAAALELARGLGAASATPILMLVDFAHTARGRGLDAVLRGMAGAGVAGVLVHGLPPRLQPALCEGARTHGLEAIGTLYPASADATWARVLAAARGFLYLVSRFGRSGPNVSPGGTPAAGGAERRGGGLAPPLGEVLRRLRAETTLPIAVGFGVASGADVTRLHRLGADACVVGSAVASLVEISGGAPGAFGRALEELLAPHASRQRATERGQRCA